MPPEPTRAEPAEVRMTLRVNGSAADVTVSAGTTLAEVLRDQLGLVSVKLACGRGECGACTVLVDGRPRMACITLAQLVTGEVSTAEGLAEETADLRAAFADHGGFQCGFCTPGQVVHAAALLREPMPAEPERRERWVRQRLSGNLCRCTGYTGIVDAICAIAERRRAGP
jgi:aerobic-type carbon monoxide dehydrogenase small subunit (CoxS/CutS family)